MINLVKEKCISGQSYETNCTGFEFLWQKNINSVKHAPQGRIIIKVHDLRIKPEVARLKQHQEKVTSRKIQKIEMWKLLEKQ